MAAPMLSVCGETPSLEINDIQSNQIDYFNTYIYLLCWPYLLGCGGTERWNSRLFKWARPHLRTMRASASTHDTSPLLHCPAPCHTRSTPLLSSRSSRLLLAVLLLLLLLLLFSSLSHHWNTKRNLFHQLIRLTWDQLNTHTNAFVLFANEMLILTDSSLANALLEVNRVTTSYSPNTAFQFNTFVFTKFTNKSFK